MIIIQTTINQRAMTALAKMTRKTVRRGRNGPVRLMAWFVVLLETYLTVIYARAGLGGWQMNLLLGGIMLACILGEDTVNGIVGLRQILPASREVNATFQENHYIHRTQGAETWWSYRQIKAIGEDKDYFAFVLDKNHGQIYAKEGFEWGSPDEFREFIQRRTGLKIRKVK